MKAAVLKTVECQSSVGSNPTSSARLFNNGHEADLDWPGLPQKVKDFDKKWAVGAKPGNVIIYVLFLINQFGEMAEWLKALAC